MNDRNQEKEKCTHHVDGEEAFVFCRAIAKKKKKRRETLISRFSVVHARNHPLTFILLAFLLFHVKSHISPPFEVAIVRRQEKKKRREKGNSLGRIKIRDKKDDGEVSERSDSLEARLSTRGH